jgi:putative acetyltransferase
MIRRVRSGEERATYDVYRDSVRLGAGRGYTLAERLAWVPSDDMEDWWPERIAASPTWVADRSGTLVGVLTFREDGYLDLFFVVPQAQGDGTAVALYDAMIDHARSLGLTHLTTHASHLARRFLERRGWKITQSEEVDRNGVTLLRFGMETTLEAPNG